MEQQYIAIPCWVFNLDLKVSEKLVLGAICSLSGKRGYCYADNGYIAECLALDVRTVANAICTLAAGGWVQKSGAQARRVLVVQCPISQPQSEAPKHESPDGELSPSGANLSPSGAKNAPSGESALYIGKQVKQLNEADAKKPPGSTSRVQITEYVFLTESYQRRLVQEIGQKGYLWCVKKLHNWVGELAPMLGERETKDFQTRKRKAYNGGATISNWNLVSQYRAEFGVTPRYTNGDLNGAIDRLEALGVPVTRIGGGGQ